MDTLFPVEHIIDSIFSTVVINALDIGCICREITCVFPAGICCRSGVVLKSMRRDNVASTSIRRNFGTKCPLGLCLGKLSHDDILFFLYHLTTFSI